MLRLAILGVTLLLMPAASNTARAPGVLLLETKHGTFLAGFASGTYTRTKEEPPVTFADGAGLDPKQPPISLRLGDAVRFSLPAASKGQPALHYNGLHLGYRGTSVDLVLAKPVWRPDKLGTYILTVSLQATWQSAVDSGTSESAWLFKLRVKR